MADRSPASPRVRAVFWCLAALGLFLNVGIVYHAWAMFSTGPTTTPTPSVHISVPYEAAPVWDGYRRWIVQEDGRNKPFDTFCRESVRTITGRERFDDHDPVAVVVSWLLSAGRECDWERHPFLLCRNPQLRSLIYGDDRPGQHVEPSTLRASRGFAGLLQSASIKMAADAKAPLPAVEREAIEVQTRLALYDLIRQGGPDELAQGSGRAGGLRVVALDRCGQTWFSLRSLHAFAEADTNWQAVLRKRMLDDPVSYEGQQPQAYPTAQTASVLGSWADLRKAYASGDAEQFSAASADFLTLVGQNNEYAGPDLETGLELWFNRTSPFQKAWGCGLLAALVLACALAIGRWHRLQRAINLAGLILCVCSLAWAATGFYCRVSVSGRPPVSNMYESIVWVAAMVAVFGLLLAAIYRSVIIALASALVSTLGFVLADQLPLTFSPSIQPLQAVLRSNYWLIVHVLTIVSSYAPLSLAWCLGNINLFLILCRPERRAMIQDLSRFCYRCIQAGVLLLFLGTMLGGFWAAESWGRFWGWDPKEVWALIALLCYLIPLHARYAGWVGDFGLSACSVVCFASVVMAWYGVNFVLGAGLHSYGFGSGEHTAIYLVGMLNISLVVHAAMRHMTGRTLPLGVQPD